MTTVTAREIAEKIQRPGEELKTAVDRVRDWTKEGLLRPEGDRHPGTGRKRQFSKRAIIDAVLLEILTGPIGIPAVSVAPLFSIARKHLPLKAAPSGASVMVFSKSSGSRSWELGGVKWDDLLQHLKRSDYETHLILDTKKVYDRLGPDWQ